MFNTRFKRSFQCTFTPSETENDYMISVHDPRLFDSEAEAKEATIWFWFRLDGNEIVIIASDQEYDPENSSSDHILSVTNYEEFANSEDPTILENLNQTLIWVEEDFTPTEKTWEAIFEKATKKIIPLNIVAYRYDVVSPSKSALNIEEHIK